MSRCTCDARTNLNLFALCTRVRAPNQPSSNPTPPTTELPTKENRTKKGRYLVHVVWHLGARAQLLRHALGLLRRRHLREAAREAGRQADEQARCAQRACGERTAAQSRSHAGERRASCRPSRHSLRPRRTSPVISSQSRPSGMGSPPPCFALGSFSCSFKAAVGGRACGARMLHHLHPQQERAVRHSLRLCAASAKPATQAGQQGGGGSTSPAQARAPKHPPTHPPTQPPTSSSGMVWPRKRMPSSGSSRLVSHNMAGMPRMPPMACGDQWVDG